jgi:non-ribosomal peptide synthetase component F
LLGAGYVPTAAQTLICTGEAMPLDLARELLPHCGALWNGYGPTETTVWSTFWRVVPGFQKILIGRPVDNTEIYVFDEHRRPVPVGVSGELYIGGDGVTRGYLGRPELTAERFLDDPARPGYKLYRTGDLGRYLADGNIECLGRNDHQVKLRGFRIELGEIEDGLVRHSDVQQATVVLREDRPGDAKLVAYLVTGAATPAPADLRAHLKTLLPEYMVPTVYVSMRELPLTPSGKIDRKALPAPDGASAVAQGGEFTAPATKGEQILADIWAELLGLGRVSVTDDFFALGGHSLLASQVMGRLRRDHGIELAFRKFFEAPTIRELARVIDGQTPGTATAMKGIVRRSSTGPLPLSISQERLFLLEEMHPAQRIVHNLPSAWELDGTVDRSALQRALDVIASRHETLRTTFARVDGQLVQRVQPSVSLPIALVDLRSVAAEERLAEAHRQIQVRNAEPFDLGTGPLFRSTLFQLDDEKFIYHTLRHNLIWDGWSFDVFIGELTRAYAAFAEGKEPALDALPVGYGDYVLWHGERLRSAALLEQQAWWRKRLQNAPKDLLLPLDRPRRKTMTYAGSSTSISLPKEEAARLTALAHANGTTLFMALFAAYVTVLHRYAGQNDILVGLPVRGRSLPELEGLIGPFINTVILRTEVEPTATFAEHLRSVRDASLEAFSHEEMPLEMLGDRPPVVRALFSFQDARSRPLELGQVRLRQIDVEPPAAANDLMVWVMEREAELVIVANFSSDVFDKSTIERFLRSFTTVLGEVTRDPAQKVADVAILSPVDRRETDRLAQALSERALDVQAPHELLEAQAGLRKDAPFLEASGRNVAWGAAPRTVAACASFLLGAGVSQGTVVGLLTSDPLELAVTTLSAWRLGAVVLPLSVDASKELNLALLRAARATVLCIGSKDEQDDFAGEGQALVSLAGLPLGDPGATVELPVLAGASALALPACLRPTWNEQGGIELQSVTQAELVGAARALTELLGSATEGAPHALTGRVLADLAPHADQGLVELVLALSTGASLVLADSSSPEGFSDALARTEVAAAWATPERFDVALERRAQLPSLAVSFGHAESYLLDDLARAAARVVAVRTANAALPGLFAHEHVAGLSGALGRALGADELRVVNQAGRPLPLGVEGRIVRGGAGESALRGRRLASGSLQIEEGGERVCRDGFSMHARAAASLLISQGAVADAFVREESAGEGASRLVAYFCPNPNSAHTDTELRRMLRRALPELLVPSVYVELIELPRGADGRVDESRLVSPFSRAGAERVAPRTENEKILAACYAEVLGTPRIDVHDNFFDLGGHSLLCLRVVHLLASRHNLVVSPRTLLLNTLEQAAAELDQQTRSDAPRSGVTTKEKEPESGLARSVFKGISGLWKGRNAR